jgi:hypothetical protein
MYEWNVTHKSKIFLYCSLIVDKRCLLLFTIKAKLLNMLYLARFHQKTDVESANRICRDAFIQEMMKSHQDFERQNVIVEITWSHHSPRANIYIMPLKYR